jgi:hypothetical protein
MRFSTTQHQFYGGLDRHARTMYLCVLNQDGEIVLHRHMKAAPEPFLRALTPYREEMVVCVAGRFTGDRARRPLRSRGDSLWPGPCPLHEGHSWRPGQAR